MPVVDEADAWSMFWEEQGPQGRCIEDEVLDPLNAEWSVFARELPPQARIVDLACGAGIVGRTLLSLREDLTIVGVDSAVAPAQADPRHQIMSSVAMESLPFEASSFGAAVSQFGIEYGNIGQIAHELARVLQPGAMFCFLVHTKESDIYREGSMRRQALRALLSSPVKAPFLGGDSVRLQRQFSDVRKKFPKEPLVDMFARSLPQRLGGTRMDRQRAWDSIGEGCGPEMSMLQQMERSAKSAQELGAWLVPLISTMANVCVSIVRGQSGKPLVWKVQGRR